MSMNTVIEILDSDEEPRCSILWKTENDKSCKYCACLAQAIGSLNDDSTTEEIIENIRDVFPSIGIPREVEFYTRRGLGMAEHALATKYADDLGLPDGNACDGVLAVGHRSILHFSNVADNMNYLYLGNVTIGDCMFEEDLEDYCGLHVCDEGNEDYREVEAEIEEIKKSAFHCGEKFFYRQITTKEDWDELLRIVNNYDWVEYKGFYYRLG